MPSATASPTSAPRGRRFAAAAAKLLWLLGEMRRRHLRRSPEGRAARRTAAAVGLKGRSALSAVRRYAPQPASSRDRAVAAATAAEIARGHASSAISTESARSVVPFGLVTARRSAAASSSLAASSAPEPDTVCRASRRARSAGMPCSIAASLQQFGQQEHIGRPAAGHRRDRIEQRLVLDPGDRADRASSPSHSARCAGVDARRRRRRRSRPGAPRPACSAWRARSAAPVAQQRPHARRCVRPAMIERNTARPANARVGWQRLGRRFCGLTASTTAAGANPAGTDVGSRHHPQSRPGEPRRPAPDRRRPTAPAPARASRPASRRPSGRSRPAGCGGIGAAVMPRPTHSSIAASSASAGDLPPHSTNWKAGRTARTR